MHGLRLRIVAWNVGLRPAWTLNMPAHMSPASSSSDIEPPSRWRTVAVVGCNVHPSDGAALFRAAPGQGLPLDSLAARRQGAAFTTEAIYVDTHFRSEVNKELAEEIIKALPL